MFDLSRWKPQHLLASWVVWWIGFIAYRLGPAVPAMLEATKEGQTGSIGVSMDNAVLNLKVEASGHMVWHGAAHLSTITLWLGVPPLLIWIAWLYARPKPKAIGNTDIPLLHDEAPGAMSHPRQELRKEDERLR